jgi:hypothetical protein
VIDDGNKEDRPINNLATDRRDGAAAVVQQWEREWFLAWAQESRPPAHVKLASVPREVPE